MKVTLPQLLNADIIFMNDADDESTTYIVSDGYSVKYLGHDVKVLQHVHVEGEGESISFLDADFEIIIDDEPAIISVEPDLSNKPNLHSTELTIRVFKEIDELSC